MDENTTHFQTDILTQNYKLSWNLYNFDRVPFLSEQPIYGPKFSLCDGTSRWVIVISKETIDEQRTIGFKLIKENKRLHWEFVKFAIVLVSKGLSVSCMTDVVSHGSRDLPFYYIRERDLTVEELEIFKAVDLTVECSLVYVYTKEGDEIVEPSPLKRIFVEDMKCLHNNKAYCDMSLVSKDGTEFACHKSIICARSIRFVSECRNLGDNSCLHLDMDQKTAKALIWYIYTGEMPHKFNEEDYKKLLVAAEYYFMPHLEKLCLHYLNAKGKISCICAKCKSDADYNTDDDLSEDDE